MYQLKQSRMKWSSQDQNVCCDKIKRTFRWAAYQQLVCSGCVGCGCHAVIVCRVLVSQLSKHLRADVK